MRSIAIQMGSEGEFEGFVTTSQCILPPKEASEVEIKSQQVKHIFTD